MASLKLENRYRVLLASFVDDPAGRVWRDRLGENWAAVTDALILNFGRDLALLPEDIGRDHLHHLLGELLPGRLSGREAQSGELAEMVLEFLLHVCREEGLAREWEWTSAVDESRGALDRALQDDRRMRLAGPAEKPHMRPGTKIGRNDPCPCGSGRKYKKCCADL